MILNKHFSRRALKLPILPPFLIAFHLFAGLFFFFSSAVSASLPSATDAGALLNLDLRVFVAGKPVYLILVEKDTQRLRVLEHDGKLRVLAEYDVATGENDGPKQEEGDEKTPEGVYFITKIYTDSKVTVFGKRAFHLNYPNIFDQEMNKGGNGIFVHGTNKDLLFNSTNGCITLANRDLENIVQYLPLDRVPIVVVPSLSTLSAQQFHDTRLESFAFNDFERAKGLMLPPELDWRQVFFESLYMIRVGKQTAVVGHYRSFAGPEALDGGFVRSYINYDEGEGWLAKESYRQEQRLQFNPLLQAQAQLFLDYKDSLGDGGRMLKQFWRESDTPYFDLYKQAIAARIENQLTQETQQIETPEKSATKQVAPPPARKSKDFFWLFLLTVSVSVGSVWVLVRIEAKKEEAVRLGEEEKGVELDERLVLAMQTDLAWIHENIADLRGSLLGEQSPGVVEELREALAQLEGELQGKEAEQLLSLREAVEALKRKNDAVIEEHRQEVLRREELETKVAQLTLADIELHKRRTELSEVSQALQEEICRRTELEKQAEELVLVQAELESGRRNLAEVTVEMQQEIGKREELENQLKGMNLAQEELQQRNADLLATATELQEERKKCENLKAQVIRLETVDQELRNSRCDKEALEAENAKLRESAKQTEYKEKLDGVQKHLEGVEVQLQEAAQQRRFLEVQVGELAEIEKTVHEMQAEIIQLTENNLQLHAQLDSMKGEKTAEQDDQHEEVSQKEPTDKSIDKSIDKGVDKGADKCVAESVIAHGTDYLPSDVLKKWLGK